MKLKMGSYYLSRPIYLTSVNIFDSKDVIANLVTIDADRVFEIIALNKRGIKPDELVREGSQEPVRKEFEDVVGQDSLPGSIKPGRKITVRVKVMVTESIIRAVINDKMQKPRMRDVHRTVRRIGNREIITVRKKEITDLTVMVIITAVIITAVIITIMSEIIIL